MSMRWSVNLSLSWHLTDCNHILFLDIRCWEKELSPTPSHQTLCFVVMLFPDLSCLVIITLRKRQQGLWRGYYLTIIPRAQMGSESIAHEAEGRMGYSLRRHEGERNNCFSKIHLVGQKYRDKTSLASKPRFSHHFFGFQSWRFSLSVGYNI